MTHQLMVPRTRLRTIGDRAFGVAGTAYGTSCHRQSSRRHHWLFSREIERLAFFNNRIAVTNVTRFTVSIFCFYFAFAVPLKLLAYITLILTFIIIMIIIIIIILVPRIVGHHLYDFVISVQIAGCTAPRCQLTKMRISQ